MKIFRKYLLLTFVCLTSCETVENNHYSFLSNQLEETTSSYVIQIKREKEKRGNITCLDLCSAVIVGPNKIVTAKHCIDSNDWFYQDKENHVIDFVSDETLDIAVAELKYHFDKYVPVKIGVCDRPILSGMSSGTNRVEFKGLWSQHIYVEPYSLKGDSGGGLFCIDENNEPTLAGVVSGLQEVLFEDDRAETFTKIVPINNWALEKINN